jgi:hypothetical protein
MIILACLLAAVLCAVADGEPSENPPPSASTNAASAQSPPAPVVVLGGVTHIIITGFNPIPRSKAGLTAVSTAPIQHADPALTIPDILARYVPGASLNPDNGLRIRGADDQASTYLDGAPIPASVSGSITDVIDPRIVHVLDVYTGGFPARFGGQLSAVFDIATQSGGREPMRMLSQSAGGDDSFVSSASAGGPAGNIAYYGSASFRRTSFFLNPPTQTPNHDFGAEDHAFLKLNGKAGATDSWIVQLGANGSRFEIPDTGDDQHESGSFANFVWRHAEGGASTRGVLYLHHSGLIYEPGESAAAESASDSVIASENLDTTNTGIRVDQSWASGPAHSFMAGVDVSRATADQNFTLALGTLLSEAGGSLVDDSAPHSWNIGSYVQDDWVRGRLLVNYGARFDENSEDVTKSQFSPRVNIKYRLSATDTVHAFYDRLFQPIAVEDAVHLVGNSSIGDNGTLSALLPESDTLYEIGIDRSMHRCSLGVSAYYKTGRNVRDDDQVGDTNIMLPVNDAKDYVRGIELTSACDLSQWAHAYGNLALSWNKNAGPVTGGLSEGALPSTYFYDDHDQTYTASVGITYGRRGVFADADADYGSGQPYGEIDNASGIPIAVNFRRVPAHFVVNCDIGKLFATQLTTALFVDNAFNDAYVIKQTTSLSNAQFAQGRIIGARVSRQF